MFAWRYVHMGIETKQVGSPVNGVTRCYEPPDMDAGFQIWVY